MKKTVISVILLLAMSLSLASCGLFKPGAEEFYIDGSAYVSMQVGEVAVLELVKPESLKGKVEWTSDDESVVIVANGTLVARGEGTTMVHATLDDYTDKVIVTVGTPKPGTGNNTGNNTGDNTGNNTGDNTGNNGDSTGGNTGDNTGNNGGSTGGNTGDNTGNTGNTGGSTTANLIGSIDFTSTAQRVSLSTAEQVWTNGSVSLTNTEGANPVADYSPIRFSSVIIDCQGMKKIVMNCDNGVKDSTGALQAAAEAAGASVVVDGETITITLPSVVNSFTMTVASQARVKTLEIYGN